jgi:hypothetical protein
LDNYNKEKAMELDEKNLEIATSLVAKQIAEQIDGQILGMHQAFNMEMTAAQVTPDAIQITELPASDDVIAFTLPEGSSGQLLAADENNWKWGDADTIHYEIAPVEEYSFTLVSPVPCDNAISLFGPDQSLIVEIKRSGEVTLGKNVDAKFAAHEFWTRLAEIGGEFEKRMITLEGDVAELEQELEDEQSMRINLESTLTDVYIALEIPSGDEELVAAYARQYREHSGRFEFDVNNVDDVVVEDKVEEDPSKAYERAMKVVR